jgi:uncharacterized protein (DUF2147 family)
MAAMGFASVLGAGGAWAASPVTGVWRAPVGHATIDVYDCGPQTVCGRVVDSDKLRASPQMRDVNNPDPTLRDRPVKGLQMMREFRGGPTRWTDGLLYNPDDGHTYHGTITLVDAHTLKLAGCIFGPLCRTQVWTRAQ